MSNILYIILILIFVIFILLIYPIKYCFLINTIDKKFYINVSYLFILFNLNKNEKYIKIFCFKIKLNHKNKKNIPKSIDTKNNEENRIEELTDLENKNHIHSNILKDYKNFKKVKNKEIKNKKNGINPIKKIKNFFNNFNIEFFKTLRNLIKYIFKYFKFDDFSLYGTIGLGNPFLTGSLLGFLGLFYRKFGDKIKIEPVFNKNVLDVNLKISGRVLLMFVLVLLVKVIINRENLKLFFDKK